MERLQAAHYIVTLLALGAAIYAAARARRAERAADRACVSLGFVDLSFGRLFRALRKQALDRGEDATLFEPPSNPPEP